MEAIVVFFIANDVSVYRSRLNVYKTRARVVICSCANLGGTCSLLSLVVSAYCLVINDEGQIFFAEYEF